MSRTLNLPRSASPFPHMSSRWGKVSINYKNNLLPQEMKDISFYRSLTPPPQTHTHTLFLLSPSWFLSACLVCSGLVVQKASFIWSFNTNWPLSPGVCFVGCVCLCACVRVCTSREHSPMTTTSTTQRRCRKKTEPHGENTHINSTQVNTHMHTHVHTNKP